MLNTIEQDIFNYGGIENYLHAQQYKTLLRFLTCGEVDDGKSTLIGRLLHDTQQVYKDQLLNLRKDSSRSGIYTNQLDLALLVDGLQSERTQGITIDVAYRYFFTKKRKFIIIDTPGHEEYTKNMVIGASNSNLAILLVDACRGIRKQTKRHWFISTLMGIKHVIVAINKMDLVNYDQLIFEDIKEKYINFSHKLSLNLNTKFIPISALNGDNIINLSQNMLWYNGPSLFEILENITIDSIINVNFQNLRFPVQYVIRNDLNFRGYAGTVASGNIHIGQHVRILPSNTTSKIQKIFNFDKNLINATTGESITITLADNVDVSRGDILIDSNQTIELVQSALVDIVWMKTEALKKNQCFDVKITTKFYRVQIQKIIYQIDIHTFEHKNTDMIPYNGIGLIELLFDEPLMLDKYSNYPVTGSMIFIDILSNDTVGAGMVRASIKSSNFKNKKFSKFELALNSLICTYFPHWGIRDLSKL